MRYMTALVCCQLDLHKHQCLASVATIAVIGCHAMTAPAEFELVMLELQVEDEAAMSTSQQQAQLLQESHTSITAALEQVAMHGELAHPTRKHTLPQAHQQMMYHGSMLQQPG